MSLVDKWIFTRAAVVAAFLSCTLVRAELLSAIGPAPDFSLTTQDEKALTMRDLRGKVVALTFIFTQCKDTCPVLTAKLVGVQRKLTGASDAPVYFVAISITPKHDTPQVLKRYALAHGADLSRWAFLTGDAKQIAQITKQYGVYAKPKDDDDMDHAFLTSIIDRSGTIRVQYMGVRFKPEEFIADLRALVQEPDTR